MIKKKKQDRGDISPTYTLLSDIVLRPPIYNIKEGLLKALEIQEEDSPVRALFKSQ